MDSNFVKKKKKKRWEWNLEEVILLGGLKVLLHEQVDQGGGVLTDRRNLRGAVLQHNVAQVSNKRSAILEDCLGELFVSRRG